MATDLVIEVDNEPGALARVATAVSDGGVNISAATCTSPGESAQLHILVKHPEAAKHALATAGVTVTSEREVVVVEAHDRPGELADLTRKIAEGGRQPRPRLRRHRHPHRVRGRRPRRPPRRARHRGARPRLNVGVRS